MEFIRKLQISKEDHEHRMKLTSSFSNLIDRAIDELENEVEIKKTIYHDTVTIIPRLDWTSYEACGCRSDSLLGLLSRIAQNGWELVGEIEGKIYVKKIELEVARDGSNNE